MLGSRIDSDIPPKLLAALEANVSVPPRLRQEIMSLSIQNREQIENLAASIVRHISLFAGTENILPILTKLDQATSGVLSLVPRDDKMRVDNEAALVLARRSAITLAAKLGFGPVERTKVATAVSELARNIVMYAKVGEVRLSVVTSPRIGLAIEARDSGPGIPDVDKVLSGGFRSKTGLGMGLRGVKNIAQEFAVQSAPGQGTRVRAVFYLAVQR
ncbi:MAG: anti-sigma regulatory factor [Myxococcales bacterium]|jgi:anti-sigma regulatory factor (Ser/Thr protein kinase)|nr:anti-sigma regulatory factor [Myxococcales bacterium]MBP8195593.1 anti-sigma regulatory factor [Deltaproteobacteria bacterium]